MMLVLKTEKEWIYSGFLHLGAGLSVGLTGLAAGYAIGVVGDMVSPPGTSTASTTMGGLKISCGRFRVYGHICYNHEYSWVWY